MTKNKYTNLLLQTLGCFISAAGIYSFAVAAEVPVTGIAGICAILYRLFGIPHGPEQCAHQHPHHPLHL